MMNLQKVMQTLKKHKAELQRLFKVTDLGIFGSYAASKQKKSSDIDILVEFAEPIGLIQFSTVQNYLADLLGIKVDLVSKKALHPKLKKQILREVVYL